MSRFYYCPRCKKQFQKEELHLMCSDCGFQFSTYKIDKAVHKQTVMKKIKPLIIVGIIILVFGSVFIFIRNRVKLEKFVMMVVLFILIKCSTPMGGDI